MIKRTFAMAIVFACSSVLCADDTQYAPKGKRFEVIFPGAPTETVIARGAGKSLRLAADGDKAFYIFYHNEFPKEANVGNREVASTLFKSGLDSALLNWKAKLLKERDFMVNQSHPAKEYEIDAPNFGIIKLQLILTKTEFYQVAVGGTKEFVESAAARKFVESFKLKD